ncbi:MAG: hypothetical protein R3D05_15770 [Dongiaceae bacterium]
MRKYVMFGAVVAGLLVSLPSIASADDLLGDAFITTMSGNSLSGTDSQGHAYDLYFLPGGEATYRDSAGEAVSGKWHLDPDGDVCVAWQRQVDVLKDGCFRVSFDGEAVTWRNKTSSGGGTLQGGVTSTFLKHGS